MTYPCPILSEFTLFFEFNETNLLVYFVVQTEIFARINDA